MRYVSAVLVGLWQGVGWVALAVTAGIWGGFASKITELAFRRLGWW